MGNAELFAVLHRHLHLELVRGLVQEQNPERPVIDDSLGQLRYAREQLIEIEHGRDFPADFSQQLECFRVEALLLEQARIDERGRDMGRELPQDVGVALRIRVAHPAQNVQRANRLLLVDQRHGDADAIPATTSR